MDIVAVDIVAMDIMAITGTIRIWEEHEDRVEVINGTKQPLHCGYLVVEMVIIRDSYYLPDGQPLWH